MAKRIIGALTGAKPKSGPSVAELQQAQNAAAQRERDRMAAAEATKKADAEKKAVSDLQAQESQRRAFAGQLAAEDDEEERRRFLKGA